MIGVEDVVRAERVRCEAAVRGDVGALASVLHDSLRYGHTSGNVDTKVSYLDKIADGRLVYPRLGSEITSTALLGDTVLCWLSVHGEVVLPAGRRTFSCSTLAVWSEQAGQARMIAHQPTVLAGAAGSAASPDRHPGAVIAP